MEYIKKSDAPRFENSPGCIATEYDFRGESDVNVASIELEGRYPERGFALNTISKELIFVMSGEGRLIAGERSVILSLGDAALIQPNEKYYLEGTLKLVISSAPAWTPEQHQNILS